MDREGGGFVHGIAVVIPVFQGELTLDRVVDELEPLAEPGLSQRGRPFQIVEIVLVHDNGPDRSDEVMRRLAERFKTVRPVWLSRNYGQHAATIAGMASTSADWIVTLDEDGQHNPADIPRLLDVALDSQVPLVYAKALNPPPHGSIRNAASAFARWLARSLMTSHALGEYSSYRLVVGELGRAVAAYGGQDIYLDVALSWVVPSSSTCGVEMRSTAERHSGYGFRSLFSHFWRLVLTSGTRPLRAVALAGVMAGALGVVLSVYLVYLRYERKIIVDGWTSVTVAVLILSGAVLFALGVVSEYVGVGVRMAMGRPPYLIIRDPHDGPLAQTQAAPPADVEGDEDSAASATA